MNAWEKLSDESKKCWFWPSPGEKLDENYNYKTNNNYKKPNNFILLGIDIIYVELLKLQKPIHKRFSWEEANNWKCLELNP